MLIVNDRIAMLTASLNNPDSLHKFGNAGGGSLHCFNFSFNSTHEI
jgi:hypothetical protein